MAVTHTDMPTQAVFEWVLARHVQMPTGSEAAMHPMVAHIWWRAPGQGNRVVQVYVDGELYDVTISPTQRECWIVTDLTHARRIELLAVAVDDPSGVRKPRPDLLTTWPVSVTSSLSAAVLRHQSLPVDTWLTTSLDEETGEQVALWPAEEHRGGFGVLFGEGAFGHDDATGLGLGEGGLGDGPLGSDGTAWRWTVRELAAGEHALAITPTDAVGRPMGPGQSISVMAKLPPAPARSLDWTGTELTWSMDIPHDAC